MDQAGRVSRAETPGEVWEWQCLGQQRYVHMCRHVHMDVSGQAEG